MFFNQELTNNMLVNAVEVTSGEKSINTEKID